MIFLSTCHSRAIRLRASQFSSRCCKCTFANIITLIEELILSGSLKRGLENRSGLTSVTPSSAPTRSFHCCPLSPARHAQAALALPTRAFPFSAGDIGKQAARPGRTYLKRSHSTRPLSGKGGSSSRGEPGASRSSSPSRAPAAPCPARASLRDPPRAPPPPRSARRPGGEFAQALCLPGGRGAAV